MKKILLAVGILVLLISAPLLAAGANIKSETQKNQLNTESTRTYARAFIWFFQEKDITIESKFQIGDSRLFGVTISGTVRNAAEQLDIVPAGFILAEIFNLYYSIEAGKSFEITCSYLRIKDIDTYDGLSIGCVAYNVKVTEL